MKISRFGRFLTEEAFIDEDIQKLRVNKIEEIDKRFSGLDEAHRLAEILHAFQCHSNHTDGCSWEYDKDDWGGYSRMVYLGFANELLKVVTLNQAKYLAVLGLLRFVK